MADPDFRFTSGDVGAVWTTVLSDDNGPVVLAAADITCVLYAPDGTSIVEDTTGTQVSLDATADPDQVTHPGQVSVTMRSTINPSGDLGWKAKFVVATPSWTRTFPTRPHKTVRVDAP